MRNPVAAAADDAVERLACGYQIRAIVGRDDPLDQRVDDGIRNAGEVLRALQVGGLRGEIAAQRIAGRARKGGALHHEIEIEIVFALLELYGIDLPPRRGE